MMNSPSSDDRPPIIDHRAHLTRLALEVGHIAAIIASLVSLLRTGLSMVFGAALMAALVLTVILKRTSRPSLLGAGQTEDEP